MSTRLDCYQRVLRSARENGDGHDYRHLGGWRKTGKAEIIRLYRQGKVAVSLAIAAKAKPKDHLAAIDSGKVNVMDIIKAGIDLEKLEHARTKLESQKTMTPEKLARELERLQAENAALRAQDARASVVVVTGAGQVAEVVAPKVERQLTVQEKAVARAMFESEERAKAKKKAELHGKRGFVVQLTDTERQAIIDRNNAKPKPTWR